jgi:murein L,D-transpeptidase YcbB/YkuD
MTSSERTASHVLADLEQQRRQADQRMRPEVETQRREAQQIAATTLDDEAIAAIQQTERALTAIAEGRIEEALAAIEQATGKINILLSRNPATALIPVNVQVNVIDTAPQSISDIVLLRDAADAALEINDLPAARTLLDSLRSEIRVRSYNLPLATYPVALQRAARLLDQKNTGEAGTVLLIALNTLAVIDQVTPLPLLLAREAVNQAQATNDKDVAQKLLEAADDQLVRLMELGYTPDNSEYSALRDEIKNLRKQLKGNEDTTSLFSRIKEKLASLTRRQSERKTRSEEEKQPKKAA